MKLFFVVFVTMLPLLSSAQKILKNADTIIITNDKSAEQNFKLAKQALADGDIEIANQDSTSYQIQTGVIKMASNFGYHYLLNCQKGRIAISGTVVGKNAMTSSYGNGVGISIPIGKSREESYQLTNKGFLKLIFKRMNDFAKKLGDNISYSDSTVETKKKSG
jgi:hypothetical protein